MIRPLVLRLLLSHIKFLFDHDVYARLWVRAEIKHLFFVLVMGKKNEDLTKKSNISWDKYMAAYR